MPYAGEHSGFGTCWLNTSLIIKIIIINFNKLIFGDQTYCISTKQVNRYNMIYFMVYDNFVIE